MRIWLVTATTLMAAAAVGHPSEASAQASVQVSATIVGAISPPASLEGLLPGGRFDIERSVTAPSTHGTQLLHTVVTGTDTEFSHATSIVSAGTALSVVKKDNGSVFERSKPQPAAVPGESRPVVVTWTIAANA